MFSSRFGPLRFFHRIVELYLHCATFAAILIPQYARTIEGGS